ncbi:hypothetical protein [Methanomassiliicoccus luminyensis]|uniref:hypothetical protein n=1 Tax=Methanomassiliicoccus luminyensis TaxID=1080712 RepID=UPI0003674126|nr:hypothetical protein [Methanomassiliicoccus luminyensis]
MFERLKKMIGGSSQGGQPKQMNAPAAAGDPYKPSLELLQDTARNLCPDPWLANKLTVDYKVENGSPSLVTSPAESLPYIRAAYAMKKDKVPENVVPLLKSL